MKGDLKKKFKKVFDAKFKGYSVTNNNLDNSANPYDTNVVNYFNRKVTK